jgi:hypothetical protein
MGLFTLMGFLHAFLAVCEDTAEFLFAAPCCEEVLDLTLTMIEREYKFSL